MTTPTPQPQPIPHVYDKGIANCPACQARIAARHAEEKK